MGKITVNTFENGMNLDSSKVVQAKNTAYSITNFRPWTDDSGKSIGGLLNIKGNEESFELPDTSPVYQLVFSFAEPTACPATTNITFSLGSGVTLSYTPAVNTCGATQSEIVDGAVAFINSDATLIANDIRAYKSDENTIIIAHLGDQDSTFSVTEASANIATTTLISTQTNIQIIGWTTIRDDYYLFTTNNTTTVGGVGQIFRLQVNEVNKTTTLSIVYNGAVNFSTEYPIEAVGRYENDCTKRLYWTDNFNTVRTINVEATDVFFTPVDNLGLIPALYHSIPVLQSIQGAGSLDSGMWQFSYRLRSSTGGETSFSPVSRMIPIVSTDESGTNYWEYLGEASGNNTGKSVTIKVANLDEDYDYIELVSLYRASKSSTPVITSVVTEPIDETGEFEYTVTGSELNSYTISLEEFLLVSRAFTHAKSLTSKDNRLFAANTRYDGLNIDFDARAYGFLQSSNIFNIDSTAYDETNPGSFSQVGETDNAINDDYSLNKFAQNSTNYGGTGANISYLIKTKQVLADDRRIGITTSSWESLPIRTATTAFPNPISLGEGFFYPQPTLWGSMKNPYIFDVYKGYQRDEIYRFAIVFYDKQGNPGYANWIADIKIPEAFDPARSGYGTDDYTNGSFRGRLVEKVGTATYYNIPYIEFTVNVSSIAEQITGYSIVRVERRAEDRTVVGQGLAFKTGPLVEIKSGATKSVSTPMGDLTEQQEYLFALGQGISGVGQYGFSANDYDPSVEGLTATTSYQTFDFASNYLTVQFPEHLYTDELNYSPGDTIKTVDTLASNNSGDYDWDLKYEPTTDTQSIVINKQYATTATGGLNPYATNIETTIEEFWKIDEGTIGGEVSIDSGIIFRNEIYSPYDPNAGGTPTSAYHGWGQKTILLKTNSALYSNAETVPTAGTHPNIFAAFPGGGEVLGSSGANDGGTNGASKGYNHYIVNYKRALANQYGGNTYTQKSQNIYISTGNIIKVEDDFLTATFDVYGGDTFMTVMDVLKAAKSWDFSSDFVTPRRSLTYLFPVESPIHTEYRHGRHVQSHFFAETGTSGDTSRGNDLLTGNCDVRETYSYNKVYSADNNIIKYYAKPFDFQADDCTDYFDTRIFASEPKVNGEVIDSWRIFGTNEFIDLESLYGPINKVYTLNDTFFSFQDRAVATVSVNPRVQTTTSDGTSLELGTGGVLHDFTYASTSIGCKHQWGVIPSRSHLYWIDINNNKGYRIGGDGLMPLSDFKGMFSYFDKNLINDIRLNELNGGDNPLTGKGITGYYDYANNEVVFTTLGNGATYTELTVAADGTYFPPGSFIKAESFDLFYEVLEGFTYNYGDIIPKLFTQRLNNVPTGFTICFNEFTQSYTSFYSFYSPMYLYNPSTLFSVNPRNKQEIYIHNQGDRGRFYGYRYYSNIKFVVNEAPVYTKVFDNIFWHTESEDSSGVVVLDDTFDSIKCYTTFQETDYTTLTDGLNLKRKEQTWQTYIPRSNTNLERLRDKHMEVSLYYLNNDNNRFLVHMIGNSFRPSFR